MRLKHRLGLTLVLALALCAMAAQGHPAAVKSGAGGAAPTLVAPDAELPAAGLGETVAVVLDVTAVTQRSPHGCLESRDPLASAAARCSVRARDDAARGLSGWLALMRSGFLSISSATPPPVL